MMRYVPDFYPPTNKIKILRTAPVERKYEEIAEISLRIKKSTRETAVITLSEKAKELGADALILMGERSVGAVAIPIGRMALALPLREIYGIAIKYKK